MPKSVLEAIKMGIWDFEPPEVEFNKFDAADAMPGTKEKLTSWPSGPNEGFRCGTRSDRDDMESPPPSCAMPPASKPR